MTVTPWYVSLTGCFFVAGGPPSANTTASTARGKTYFMMQLHECETSQSRFMLPRWAAAHNDIWTAIPVRHFAAHSATCGGVEINAKSSPITAAECQSSHSATYKKEEVKRTLSGDARIVLF